MINNQSNTKKKLPRGLQVLIGVLVISLLASVMTSMFTPSTFNKSNGSTADVDKEVVYIPVKFGGTNVGSYQGVISGNIIAGEYSLGIAPTSEVKTSEIDYFTLDMSIDYDNYALSTFSFGLNLNELTSYPFSYESFEEQVDYDDNGNPIYSSGFRYSFPGGSYVYDKLDAGEFHDHHITLVYKINHEDLKHLECKVYADGEYVSTVTVEYSQDVDVIDYFVLKASNGQYVYNLEYLEMNVFDKGYEGPLVEYYNDNTLNLSDCTDAYLNYKNNG